MSIIFREILSFLLFITKVLYIYIIFATQSYLWLLTQYTGNNRWCQAVERHHEFQGFLRQ